MEQRDKDYLEMVDMAGRRGAAHAKVIDSSGIVVDRRVRLKCAIPVCSSYNRHLMCPPNTMPVDEFEKIVRAYGKALIVQVEGDTDSSDRSESGISKELDDSIGPTESQRALHRIVNELEAAAFKKGFYLATGLIGGECLLCPECVPPSSGEPCRHPFEARPSMEAMGIDVVKTCRNAGLKVDLSSKEKVMWTGIVLLD